MTFVNEKLSPLQREEFAQKRIKNPLSPTLPVLKPVYWTINKKKDVYIFRIGVHRDYPNEEIFFFCWKDKALILPIKKENQIPNTRVWSLVTEWSKPIEKIDDISIIKELIEDLKDALGEHQLDGTSEKRDMNINIVCNFNE